MTGGEEEHEESYDAEAPLSPASLRGRKLDQSFSTKLSVKAGGAVAAERREIILSAWRRNLTRDMREIEELSPSEFEHDNNDPKQQEVSLQSGEPISVARSMTNERLSWGNFPFARQETSLMPGASPTSPNTLSPPQLEKQNSLWDNFQTVSFKEDRSKHVETANQSGAPGTWARLLWSATGFATCAAVGLCTACCAQFIDRSVNVLSSLRFGICNGGQTFSDYFTPLPFCVHPSKFVKWGELEDAEDAGFDVDYMTYVVIGVFFACMACISVQLFAPKAAGSGIPEIKTILGGFIMNDVLSFRTLVIKCLGLILSVSSGLALGKEGPLVHVACCVAALFASLSARYRENEAQTRELLSAACSAGISSAFGAPLGGVLFSLEEVSSFFPQSTLLLCFVAALTASVMLRVLNGAARLTVFAVSFDEPINPWEIPFFAMIGVGGGLIGAMFVAINGRVMKWRKTITHKWAPLLEVFLFASATLLVSYPSNILRPLSSDTIHELFSECNKMGELGDLQEYFCDFKDGSWFPKDQLEWEVIAHAFIAAFLRWSQMCFTFGSTMPAGLFVPSLFVGACCGRVVGHGVLRFREVFQLGGTRIYPGAYAMIGAASVLGGVCRVTISLVVIMFELTGGLEYTVPFMVAVLMAKWTGDAINHGIYDVYIMLRGYPFLHEEIDITYQQRAVDVMRDRLSIISLTHARIKDVFGKFKRHSYRGYPVVQCHTSMYFIGYVRADKLKRFLKTHVEQYNVPEDARLIMPGFSDSTDLENEPVIDISKLVDMTVVRMVPDTPLHVVHTTFKQLGLRHCFFVVRGRLVGLLTKKMFLRGLRDGQFGNKKDVVMSSPKAGGAFYTPAGESVVFPSTEFTSPTSVIRPSFSNTFAA